jgi:hypothetical protein
MNVVICHWMKSPTALLQCKTSRTKNLKAVLLLAAVMAITATACDPHGEGKGTLKILVPDYFRNVPPGNHRVTIDFQSAEATFEQWMDTNRIGTASQRYHKVRKEKDLDRMIADRVFHFWVLFHDLNSSTGRATAQVNCTKITNGNLLCTGIEVIKGWEKERFTVLLADARILSFEFEREDEKGQLRPVARFLADGMPPDGGVSAH